MYGVACIEIAAVVCLAQLLSYVFHSCHHGNHVRARSLRDLPPFENVLLLHGNQAHINFVKSNFEAFGPVAFFSYFGFKATASPFATELLKDVVRNLQSEAHEEKIRKWALSFAAFDFQVYL